jgi:hypothetical protein
MRRFPLDVAQEIGSFLSRQDLDTCVTQLCLNSVTFVSTPVADIQTTVTIPAHVLIATCTSFNKNKFDETKIARDVIQRIKSYLVRRPHIERIVLFAAELLTDTRNGAIFKQIPLLRGGATAGATGWRKAQRHR